MIKCTFFITRSDGSHNMKQFKNIFKDLKMDEDNYIEMSLKKFTMNLQFKFYCKSLDFYLEVLKRLMMNTTPSNDAHAVMETLLKLIDYGSPIEWTKDKIKVSYKDGTVTLILDENKRESDWVFYASDVYAFRIVYDKSMSGDGCTLNIETTCSSPPSKFSIYYDYESHRICMDGNLQDISKKNAVILFILYNSGCLKNGQSIILKDEYNNSAINYNIYSRK